MLIFIIIKKHCKDVQRCIKDKEGSSTVLPSSFVLYLICIKFRMKQEAVSHSLFIHAVYYHIKYFNVQSFKPVCEVVILILYSAAVVVYVFKYFRFAYHRSILPLNAKLLSVRLCVSYLQEAKAVRNY